MNRYHPYASDPTPETAFEPAPFEPEPPDARVVVALKATRDALANFDRSERETIERLIACKGVPTGDIRTEPHALLNRSLVQAVRLARRHAGEDTGPDRDWRLVWDLDRWLVSVGLSSAFDPAAVATFEIDGYDPLTEAAYELDSHPRVTYGFGANCGFAVRELHRLDRLVLDAAARDAAIPFDERRDFEAEQAEAIEDALRAGDLDAARDFALGP